MMYYYQDIYDSNGKLLHTIKLDDQKIEEECRTMFQEKYKGFDPINNIEHKAELAGEKFYRVRLALNAAELEFRKNYNQEKESDTSNTIQNLFN